MKIKDILTKVNKSKQFEDEVSISFMAEKMDLWGQYGWTEQKRLASYYIGSWYCTDSYVGYRVYFLDDEPVCVSSQTGRKMTEEIEWISKEAFIKVREYVVSLEEKEEIGENIPLVNMEEEIGNGYKINFNSQLFDYHKEISLFEGRLVKIVECQKDAKENFYIAKSVKIKLEDKSEKWVEVGELDFPWNLKFD